jgi:hypothetical protein
VLNPNDFGRGVRLLRFIRHAEKVAARFPLTETSLHRSKLTLAAITSSARARSASPQGRDLCWSLDCVADALVSGRRFRILAVVDDFTRECLGLL